MGQVQIDLAQADWDWGRDPFPRLKAASQTLQPASSSLPQAAINFAEATAREARYLEDLGRDPTAATRKALERFEQAARLANDNPLTHSGRGLALLVQAQHELEQGVDPQRHLVDARAAAEAAAAHVEKDDDFWRVLGSAQWLDARWRALHGDRRLEGYEHAADTYETGLKSFPGHWELLREYALVCLDWAERAPASPALERALRLTLQMRQLRPRQPEARAFLAYAEGLTAKRLGSGDRRKRALDDLDDALKQNRNLVEAWKRRRAELAAP
jgi:tetratricopeptide (TPR) repeat protein